MDRWPWRSRDRECARSQRPARLKHRHLLFRDCGHRPRLRHRRQECDPAITAAPLDAGWRTRRTRGEGGECLFLFLLPATALRLEAAAFFALGFGVAALDVALGDGEAAVAFGGACFATGLAGAFFISDFFTSDFFISELFTSELSV